MILSNKTKIIGCVVICVIIGVTLAFIPTNINQDDTSSTNSTSIIKINQTVTITNTTTITISGSTSIVTTTLPPNIVTVTSTATTIIHPQETTINTYILGDNSTTTYTVHSNTTITRTLTANWITTTKDWSISGAKISQPSLVESITFTFTNYDRLLQIGSYISFSADYVTIVSAVKNENSVPNVTNQIKTGNIEIDGNLYQYSMFAYRNTVTNELHYGIIAAYFYPDFLRTYYIFYETSGEPTIAEMKDYLGTFEIGI